MSHILRPYPVEPSRTVPKTIPSQTAARSESAVAIDLLGLGLDVYPALGAHGVVDCIAIHREQGVVIRVEVKTGVVPPRGDEMKVYLRPLRGVQRYMPDVIAIVDPRDLWVSYIKPHVSMPRDEVPTIDLLASFTSDEDESHSEPPDWTDVGHVHYRSEDDDVSATHA